MINLMILSLLMQCMIAVPITIPKCDPRLVRWLKMPLDAPEKKELLIQLLRDPAVDFECQRNVKAELDAESVLSIGYYPIDQMDPDRITKLPLAITQVILMGDKESALQLLNRNVRPDFDSRRAALRKGDLELVRRVFEASRAIDLTDDIPSYYLPAAIQSGNSDVLSFAFNLVETAKYLDSFPYGRGATAVGEYGSAEMAKSFLDLLGDSQWLKSSVSAMLNAAEGRGNLGVTRYIKERFPDKNFHLENIN